MILEGEMKKIGKRLIAAALAATLVMMPSGMATAEEGNSEETATVTEAEQSAGTDATSTEEIKDGTVAITSDDPEAAREAEREAGYKIQPDTNGLEGWPEGPAVYADSAIVHGYEFRGGPVRETDRCKALSGEYHKADDRAGSTGKFTTY